MKETYNLLLAGGTVVAGNGRRRADVAIRDGVIVAVGPNLQKQDVHEVIDVSGKFVLPGVLDVHVHPVYLDDVEACSRTAAYGGTTSILFFAYALTGESLLQRVQKMLKDASERSLLDFGLHGGMFDSARQVPEIPEVMAIGVRTFKFFLTYLKQGWNTDDYQLIRAMDTLAKLGGMAMVHAENGGGIDYLEDKLLKGPHAKPENFGASRPAALEEEAIFRAICLSEIVGCPLYIPHVTSSRALRPIRQAHQEHLPVYAETCPQYLTLTEDILSVHGAFAKVGPPIRSEDDQLALWHGLVDGTIDVIASDHAPKKKDVNGIFLEQSFGSPQIETLLPITYDSGVNRGRLTLERLVQVMCENPAKIFGLFPRKGIIAVGSDADCVVFDPQKEMTITSENQHSNAGYTLYEGRAVLGWPEMSFQRGRKILWQGQIVADPGSGEFLPTLTNQ